MTSCERSCDTPPHGQVCQKSIEIKISNTKFCQASVSLELLVMPSRQLDDSFVKAQILQNKQKF